jgi:uncharacterized protein YhaN
VRISDLQVDGFGIWKGLTVAKLADDMTVFYGQNEAGKTTLMQFVRSILFGFAPERLEKYTPSIYGGLAGGSVFVAAPNGNFEVQRHVDPNRHADATGDLTVIDNDDGDVHGSAQLAQIMSNIDESIFNNVFAVGLREIQELGALNNTQAAEHLYRLTSGVDRVSLVDVMRDLNKRREQTWSDDPQLNSRLTKLQHKRQQLLREIEELRARTKRWSRVATQAKEAGRRIDEIVAEIKRLEREMKLVEVSMQVAERWQSRTVVAQQIDSFGKLPDPRDVSVSRLNEINEKIARQKERIEQAQNQRVKIRKDALQLPINRSLWKNRGKIDALSAHSPWIESLQRQATQLKTEISRIESTMTGEVDGLGPNLKLKAKDIQELGPRRFAGLRNIARQLSEQNRLLARMKEEADKAKFELGQQEQVLGESLSEHTGSIPETLDDTSRHVNRLRRRIELEEKIQKLTNNQKELEREVDNVVSEQVLPVNKLTIIGIVFVAGIIMAGFGLFSSLWTRPSWNVNPILGQASGISTDVGLLLMILGTVFGFLSLGLKYHWERVAREEMDDFRHQMDLVRQQLKRTRNERDEIDRLLPLGSSQWDLDLKDSESRLMRLEGLVPMENRAKSARMRLEDVRRQISTQEREVETHEKKWQSSLRGAGLPDSLTPAQVKEISLRSDKIVGFNSRLGHFQSELAEREKELNLIGSRVSELIQESAPDIKFTNPLAALSQLTSRLGEQLKLVETRKDFLEQYRTLRTAMERARRDLDKLLGCRQKLLTGVGVETENEYRQFDVKHSQREKLIDQRKQLGEQIAAALGANVAESDVSPLLQAYGHSGLEKRWEALQAEIEQLKGEQTKLLQQRGEFVQEIKMMSEDSRLDTAKLELNSIEAEMQQRYHQWQTLCAGTQLLEAIREGYESKRQPETLKEASTYLDQLTEGQYKRIWTRLVGEELLVDNRQAETISVDKLSRGTREAVYLSLRLALVSAYARRGAVLPLVLDDVLVNFDAQRARSAARLLRDFSRNGYQILMFTCHNHMRDLFHSLDADVRVLPHHKDVVEKQAIPIRYQPQTEQVASPETMVPSAPAPVPDMIPQPVVRRPIQISTDDYDPELEFELSALAADQAADERNQRELVSTRRFQPDIEDLPHEFLNWLPAKTERQTA